MTLAAFDYPGLAIGLALAAGILAQAVARHAGIPGIVLLLGTGVMLGPDGLGAIRPAVLGQSLDLLVGFAVAVILFEGGLNLDIRRLRREQRSIRQLVTVGAAVTMAGGTLTVRLAMGWDWGPAVLFGTLVMVTGPTVVTPLLARLKLDRSVATVLEAEGVLIDAIGAVTAVVALEVVLAPGESYLVGLGHFLLRLGFGALAGLVAGTAIAGLLRVRNLVPEGLENVFTLAMVLALFQGCNAVLGESGLVAVTAAGLIVGNIRTPVRRELAEFKEQLTVMLIGMLFVLLAADVRLREVQALGWPGVATVLALMLIVRPATVAAGTWGAGMRWRQKVLLAWIGPRGIVAAAVASLFAAQLSRAGLHLGNEMRALVFLTIAATVLSAGLTGGFVGRMLRLRRPAGQGWVILGANDLALTLAQVLREQGSEALCIESDPLSVQEAESERVPVIYGNGLAERTLQRAQIDIRAGAIGLSHNEEANLLFVQTVRRIARIPHLYAAVSGNGGRVTYEMLRDSGAEALFCRAGDVAAWSRSLREETAAPARWRLSETPPGGDEDAAPPGLKGSEDGGYVALTSRREGEAMPIGEAADCRPGDVVTFLVRTERMESVSKGLREGGWLPADDGDASAG